MKKIEKLEYEHIQYESDEYGSVIDIEKIVNKINEIIDRLNQEVSQPEEYAKEMDKSKEGVLESCAEAILNESQIKVENNTEEWEDRLYKKSESSGIDCVNGDGRVRVTYILEDLVSEVRQLISERSFSKEELFELKLLLNDTYNKGNRAFESISKKVDRLLSLEKEK